MPASTPSQPNQHLPIKPLDPPMVPIAIGGTVAWAVVGLVLLLARGWLTAHGRQGWLGICLAGLLIGVAGWGIMIRHDANRRRRLGQGPEPR